MTLIEKLDETDYTQLLSIAINTYVSQNNSKPLSAPYCPHATKQSFKNLDRSSCFDLIAQITNSSILVLEIKVSHDNISLHSFNSQQRIVDSMLRKSGIPMEYCYNLVNDYTEKNSPEYTLTNSLVAEPDLIAKDNGNLCSIDKHEKLKVRIDQLLNGSANGGELGALFSIGFLKSMKNISTKLLFFSYNSGSLKTFTLEQLIELYESYAEQIQLGSGIDFKKESGEKILSEFKNSALELKKLVQDYKESLRTSNTRSSGQKGP